MRVMQEVGHMESSWIRRVGAGRAARVVGVLSVIIASVAGCKKQENAYVPPPPPEVTVANPVTETIKDALEFTGTTRGLETVEVRARVRGFIEKRHVGGGQRVKAGDLIYTIDAREFAAQVKAAEADVEVKQAQLRLAEVTLNRVTEARSTGAISQIEVDRAAAERDAARAQVELSKAMVVQKKLDLEFTQVKSPINGRLGIVDLDPGALVGAGEATLLATVINDEKVYADYTIDEQTIIGLRKRFEYKRPGEDGRGALVVNLGMAGDEGFPYVGAFSKSDNAIDPQTGTIRIESIFDNPRGEILPGSFVRLQAVFGEKQAMLVPDVAVQSDQRGRFVLVVGKEDKVEPVYVQVGDVVNRRRVIESGLASDAKVIVNGLQRARPGAVVKAVAEKK
jgi:RND family efflux transporter MFP subunit